MYSDRSKVRGGWLALCCALSACDGSSAKEPPQRPLATERGHQPETSAEAAPSPPPAPAVAALPPAPNPPGEAAYAHWDAAGQASRAIRAGDLPAAAPHLAWLAHHEYPQKLPTSWQPQAARMQLAARVLARASTARDALRSLPALHAACGSCHAVLASRDFDATEGPTGHGDGAIALLQGLSGPAEAVYAAAARAAPRIAGADKADRAALAALKAASARAAAATTWVERLAATEAIFGQCGSCHVSLR